jgi:hypothetical protein|tara:strand:- start:50 stop:427 length:378 start_codon:yes stop_codon:yes gene_type:complete
MAVYTVSNPTAIASKLVFDASADATDDADGDNVTSATSGAVYLVQIDNSKNTTDVYLKIADASSAAPGTTTPGFVFYAPASRVASYTLPAGHLYSSGVSIWCTTGAAKTDATSPAKAVEVRIMAS